MKTMEYRVNFPAKAKKTTLMATSCWHYGNPAIHEEGVAKFLKKAKKYSWIHHGDVIEGITPYDKRFEKDAHEMSLMNSVQIAAGKIEEAQSSCIGLIKGNHESAPSKDIGDVSEDMAMRAGVTYLSATCFLRFICPDGDFTGFFCHGNGSANYRTGEPERKKVNKSVKLRQILQMFNADICGMGHLHTSIATAPCEEMKLSIDEDMQVKRRPFVTRPGWYYAAPSMFKTYNGMDSNYAEEKIFPANSIGWIEYDVSRAGEILCIREVDENGKTIDETTKTTIR